MPWTETARREYARASMRYASDLNDREWELVAPRIGFRHTFVELDRERIGQMHHAQLLSLNPVDAVTARHPSRA